MATNEANFLSVEELIKSWAKEVYLAKVGKKGAFPNQDRSQIDVQLKNDKLLFFGQNFLLETNSPETDGFQVFESTIQVDYNSDVARSFKVEVVNKYKAQFVWKRMLHLPSPINVSLPKELQLDNVFTSVELGTNCSETFNFEVMIP